MKKILSLQNIGKNFAGLKAIENISIDIFTGRVHTILGENGAGKSTLMKILVGVYKPTKGSILLNDEVISFKTPDDSRRAGISIAFQELSLANNLSVAENIFANNEPNNMGFISFKRLYKQAEYLLNKYKVPISAKDKVGKLSMGQRQLVEIMKSISYESKIIIMDEPTASLSENEASILFSIIDELKKQEKAIIFISHRMEEVMMISDDITVLRDGNYIDTVKVKDTEINTLISMMVGRKLDNLYPKSLAKGNFEESVILAVKNLYADNCFKNISFDLEKGKILVFFGLIGSGRSELMKAIFGKQSYQGDIFIKNKKVVIKNPEDAIKHGIAFVTENRKEEGLILEHDVQVNVNMVNFKKIAGRFFLDKKREHKIVKDAITKLNIKASSPYQKVGELSGGNQQKCVISKWLEINPDILILDEPTKGIDVGAKYEIYSIIRKLASQGTAIILVSSELPEAINMADDLIVMRDKQYVIKLSSSQLNQETVMNFATGVLK